MKKINIAFSAFLMTGLVAACSAQETFTPKLGTTQVEQVTSTASNKALTNGMWVEDTTKHLSSPRKISKLIKNLETEGITNIYVSFDKEDGLEEKYTYLNQLAHQKGMRVFASIGEPEWATRGELAVEYIEDIAKFNETEENGHFDGVLLEINPYEDIEDRNDFDRRTGLLDEWLQNSHLWKQLAEEQNLLLFGSFPSWLDSSKYVNHYYSSRDNRPFFENMLEVYDGYVVKVQSNNIEEIVVDSLEEVKSGDRLKKEVFITLETNGGPNLIEYYSFNDWSKEDFRLLTELLEDQFQTYSSYKGFSIHSYDGWSNMKEK